MSDDHASPVWARTRKRSGGGGGGFVGLLVTLLALFGVLTAVLGIKERSLAEAGTIMDGWIVAGVAAAERLAGRAADGADKAATKTGDALEAGAETTAEEMRTP
ncbi:hypothetical protein [Brevundimonas sp. LM2]|uniref:hypothetical protein n=1 Tax=Brevundimonas sp. LM2 TaxID=1938605 RepID=UPI00209AF368|nr:hypothetical protein [Brevundimonas sp. LM2]